MGDLEEKKIRIDVGIASKFWDCMQDIINICLLKNEKEYPLINENFNELEAITQKSGCLEYIREARSSFIDFYENKNEGRIDEIMAKLSTAYDILIGQNTGSPSTT